MLCLFVFCNLRKLKFPAAGCGEHLSCALRMNTTSFRIVEEYNVMDLKVCKEQKDIIKAAREFALGEFPDRAQEFDRNETFDLDIWRKACELGFVGVCLYRSKVRRRKVRYFLSTASFPWEASKIEGLKRRYFLTHHYYLFKPSRLFKKWGKMAQMVP